MTYNAGDKIPVWWATFDKDEKGNNLAFVLEIRDYIGTLVHLTFVVKFLNLPALIQNGVGLK
jgi:hypothetical protein